MKAVDIDLVEFEGRFEHEKKVLFTSEDFDSNAKMQVIRILPGQKIKPHKHNKRTEAFHIVSGNGEIRVNGEVAATSSSQFILCNPGDVHEFINKSDDEKFVIAVFRTNDPGDEDMIWVEEE